MSCAKQWAAAIMLAVLLQPGSPSSAQTAQKPLQPGIIGKDDRRIVNSPDRAWTAIGHVRIQGYRTSEQCTGTRIAPGLVLTAAHCVINFLRNAPHLPKYIHFTAGVDKDKNAGHAVAACVIFPDDFNIEAQTLSKPDLRTRLASLDFLRRDIALIVLKSDTANAGLIAAAPVQLPAGQSVSHAGYHRDRRQMLMLDEGCKVQGTAGDLIATDCDAVAGSSGGPVLVETDGKLAVAAVMVASSQDASFAVPLSAWPRMLANPACP